jgi:hypothetical protein
VETNDLDRDKLLQMTIARGTELAARRERHRHLARRVPTLGLVILLTAGALTVAATRLGREAGRPNHPTESSTSTRPQPAPPLPIVDTARTPRGWYPVDYGLAQIAVPDSWSYLFGTPMCGGYGRQAAYIASTPPTQSPPCPKAQHPARDYAALENPATFWTGNPPQPTSNAPYSLQSFEVNGFNVECICVPTRVLPRSVTAYLVPQLDVVVFANPNILRTLTYSPRAVVNAAGPAPVVPKSWEWGTVSGIKFAVPAAWHPTDPAHPESVFPACAGPDWAPTSPGVVVAPVLYSALAITCPIPVAPPKHAVSWLGVATNDNRYPSSSAPGARSCRQVETIRVCLQTDIPWSPLDVLATVSRVGTAHCGGPRSCPDPQPPDAAPPLIFVIGLSGNGMTARTILYSLRPA